MVYFCVPAKLFAQKETIQPSRLPWDMFTTVYKPNCLHWKKTLAELFVLGWIVYSVPVELFAKKEPPGLFALRWVSNSAPVKLFALKEKSGSLAVCTDIS